MQYPLKQDTFSHGIPAQGINTQRLAPEVTQMIIDDTEFYYQHAYTTVTSLPPMHQLLVNLRLVQVK